MESRVRIFVDYWNFTLDMKDYNPAYRIDYEKLSDILMRETQSVVGGECQFLGVSVYTSINPLSAQGRKDRDFYRNTLEQKRGFRVNICEQRPKSNIICQNCNYPILMCPNCNQQLRKMVEKGVDTGIVTEMMQGAWDNIYDVAVILSSDKDIIPAVDYLGTRNKKIIHASFGNSGMHLSQKCWARINLSKFTEEMKRS